MYNHFQKKNIFQKAYTYLRYKDDYQMANGQLRFGFRQEVTKILEWRMSRRTYIIGPMSFNFQKVLIAICVRTNHLQFLSVF